MITMTKTTTIIAVLVAAVVVGGGAFFGGMKFAQAKGGRMGGRAAFMAGGPGFAGGQGGRGGMMGAGFVAGEVLNKDEKSMTVKLRDGGSKIIFFGDAMTVSKNVDGTLEDVSVGSQVSVTGATNSDGSVSATSVQLRPEFMMIKK